MPPGQGWRSRSSGLAAGAMALAVAGMVAKALSALARVLFARWLGAEAIGLYEMAMPVLALGISVCGLGIPVAAAALLAAAVGRGDRDRVAALLRTSRLLLVGAGVAGGAAVVVFAPDLARLLGNPASAGPLRAVGPAILLASVLAGEKSWLQASGRTTSSAAVLTAEQGVRVAAAIVGAFAFLGRAALMPALAAMTLAWSPAAGTAGGLLAAVLAGRRPWTLPTGTAERGRPDPRSPGGALLAVGGPNWLSGMLASGASAVDAALVTWKLRLTGMGAASATAALGELNGMAMPLAAAPAVLFGALGSALVPVVAADWARGDQGAVRRRGEAAYFWVVVSGLPCAVLLWQLAGPISGLLYRNTAAAAPLGFLAFAGLPLGLSYVAAALANAVGRPAILLPGVVSGAIVRSALILALTGSAFGIRGAAAGVLAGFTVSATLNVRAVGGLLGCWPAWTRWAGVTAPALAAQVAAASACWGALGGWVPGIRILLTVLCAAMAYGCVLALGWAAFGERLGLPGIPLRR